MVVKKRKSKQAVKTETVVTGLHPAQWDMLKHKVISELRWILEGEASRSEQRIRDVTDKLHSLENCLVEVSNIKYAMTQLRLNLDMTQHGVRIALQKIDQMKARKRRRSPSGSDRKRSGDE